MEQACNRKPVKKGGRRYLATSSDLLEFCCGGVASRSRLSIFARLLSTRTLAMYSAVVSTVLGLKNRYRSLGCFATAWPPPFHASLYAVSIRTYVGFFLSDLALALGINRDKDSDGAQFPHGCAPKRRKRHRGDQYRVRRSCPCAWHPCRAGGSSHQG